MERLHSSRKEIEEQLQNRRKELNQLVDPLTGQEFFKPKVGRPPRSQRNAPITEYLYAMREKKATEVPRSSQLMLVSNPRSQELLVKRKRARYLEIFTLINPCGCEKIYTEVINLQEICPEIVRILTPLLQELDDTGEKIDFEEFFDSMENLCKVLTPEERNTLLKDRIMVQERVEEEGKRKSISAGKIYSRNMKFKEGVEAKLLAERMKKSEEELKDCSFHPKIKLYKRESSSARRNCNWFNF